MQQKSIIVIALLITLAIPLWAQAEEDFAVTLTSDGQGAVIIRYTGAVMDVIIPAVIQDVPVREIGQGAFRGSHITSVEIPEGVETIGNNAFLRSAFLESVTFPEGLTTIGNWAFYECTSLESVTFPESLTTIGSSAFYRCTSLTSVTFAEIVPESQTTIGNWAFSGCTSLTSVTFPDGITTIGEGAFLGNTALTTVIIPDSVEAIVFRGKVFAGSPQLTLASQEALRRTGYR